MDKLNGAVREWSVTASTTSANVSLASLKIMGRAIQVINDGAVTVYVVVNSNEATNSPTNGDEFFSVAASESTEIEVQFNQFSYIAASGTCAIRIRVVS